MNEHIELIKKFLADSTSVTEEELESNKDVAYRAYDAAYRAAEAAYEAAEAAEAAWAYQCGDDDVEYYKNLAIKAIAEYEELTR